MRCGIFSVRTTVLERVIRSDRFRDAWHCWLKLLVEANSGFQKAATRAQECGDEENGEASQYSVSPGLGLVHVLGVTHGFLKTLEVEAWFLSRANRHGFLPRDHRGRLWHVFRHGERDHHSAVLIRVHDIHRRHIHAVD